MDVEKESNDEKPACEDLCRLCANTDKQLIPIFQGEGIEHNIAEQISKYLPIITVTKIDKLPLQICYQCTSTLIAWHNFFEQCRVADNRLREILPVDVKLNPDDESYHDYTDDFHDDFEDQPAVEDQTAVKDQTEVKDQVAVSDNVQAEAVLTDATVSDTQPMETSDNEPVIVDTEISPAVTENLTDSRPRGEYQCLVCPMSANTSEEIRLHLDQAHIFIDLVDPNTVVGELVVCDLPAGAIATPAKKLEVVRTLVKLEDLAPAPYRVPKREPEQTEKPKLQKGQESWVIRSKAQEGVRPGQQNSGVIQPKLKEGVGQLPSGLIKPKVKKRAAKPSRWSRGVPKLEERATQPGQQPSGVTQLKVEERATEPGQQPGDVIEPKMEEQAVKPGHRPRQLNLIPFDVKDLPESLQCLVCSQEGLTATQLTQHFTEHHLRVADQTKGEGLLEPQLMGYCCPECGLCQETLEPMLAHYMLEHPTSELLLGELRRREPLQLQLAQLCLLCVRYFRLAGHYYSAHRCFNRIDKAGLEALVRELRRPPCYWCDVCAATFRWKVHYRLHRQTRHRSVTAIDWEALQPAQIPHVCESCRRGFVEEATMRAHLCGLDAAAAAAEMETRPVRRRHCPYCERHFGCDSSLKYHVATRHTHQKIPPRDRNRRRAPTIECPFCALKFKLSSQLALHTLTVHGRKLRSPFYCAKCERTFKSNKGLQMHKAVCAGGESLQPRKACAGGESQKLRKTCVGGDESQQLRKACAGDDESQQLSKECAGGDESHELRKECAGGDKSLQLRKECSSGELAARMCAVACKLTGEGELLYGCDVCGREFDQPGDYFAHRSSHEVPSAAAVVKCKYCSREFKSKLAVNIHHTIAHKDEIALARA